ncbi:LACTB2 (predicted) [Pycnogonum litorale]
MIPKISNLTPSIIRILGCNPGPMTLQGTNTYLIGTGKRRILIDTGDAHRSEYVENLRKVLSDHQASVEHIVLTHWHHDHVGGLADVLNKLDVDSSSCSIYKFRGNSGERSNVSDDIKSKFNYLEDGSVIRTDGASLKIIHSPGHTDDHIVLYLEEDRSLFSGDCILGEGTAVFEDLYSYMKSLNVILSLNPSVIYPGHGPVIDNPIPKINEYIEHRNQRERQIMEALSENPDKSFTSMELVKVIYKDTPINLHNAAAKNVTNHLDKLAKESLVVEENSRYRAT